MKTIELVSEQTTFYNNCVQLILGLARLFAYENILQMNVEYIPKYIEYYDQMGTVVRVKTGWYEIKINYQLGDKK